MALHEAVRAAPRAAPSATIASSAVDSLSRHRPARAANVGYRTRSDAFAPFATLAVNSQLRRRPDRALVADIEASPPSAPLAVELRDDVT